MGIKISVKANHDLPVHNIDTGLDYATIREAIDANETLNGHTIKVDVGIYREHVYVNKAVSLIGESRDRTIVDSGGVFRGFIVNAKKANITGFTVQRARWAIHLNFSGANVISGNRVRDSDIGIYLKGVNSSTICDNICEDILPEGECIYLWGAMGNVVSYNLIANASHGVFLTLSNENLLVGNIIRNCSVAINTDFSHDNIFYRNNFVHNIQQLENFGLYSMNTWDDGYPAGGNYWSDYTPLDEKSGPYRNETGSDGICDAPYLLDDGNQDNYPLMGPINFFDAGNWDGITYRVGIVSNSSVSDFNFDQPSKLIHFNATGPELTDVFSRVSILKKLLWCDSLEEWRVNVTGIELPPEWRPRIDEDDNYTYLYITYRHPTSYSVPIHITGTHVIPEFPSSMIMPILMAATLLAVTAYRKKPKSQY